MKVTLVNHSDIRGGASMASLRLLRALRDEGVDARMIVKNIDSSYSSKTEESYIEAVGGGLRDKLCFLGERAEIFGHNGFSREHLFKVSTASCGLDISRHPWVTDADIIVLNWINQGMLSLGGIEKLGVMKPLVWTMHDMWPMTGICHIAPENCKRYKDRCGYCPLLGRCASDKDISSTVHSRKKVVYDTVNPHFVAVSSSLADCARQSSLLGGRYIEVINNAFDADNYTYLPGLSRKALNLPGDGYELITMCAARLDDDIKNLPAAIDALNIASQSTKHKIAAVFIGEIRDTKLLHRLQIPYAALGTINDSKLIANIYAHSKAVISSSHFETLGYTLIEGMAAGAYPVAFGGDGRNDIIDHLADGYIAQKGNNADLAKGIVCALSSNIPREELHNRAVSKFGAKAAARKYIKLFNKILTPVL